MRWLTERTMVRGLVVAVLVGGMLALPAIDVGAGDEPPPAATTFLATPNGTIRITLSPDSAPEGDWLTFVLSVSVVSGGFPSDPIQGVMFTAGKGEAFGGSATATRDADYGHTRRSFTFRSPGQFSIDVPTYPDGEVEGDEWFKVLATPTGAFPPVIFDVRVEGWIIDDAPVLPSLAIEGARVPEGDAGSRIADFEVTVTPAPTSTVTVEYGTCGIGCHPDATAEANVDYSVNNGTLTFATGETSKTIPVEVQGDTDVEPDEDFYVLLWDPVGATVDVAEAKGTILDDDATGPPTCDFSIPPFTDLAGSFAVADIGCLYDLGITQGVTATTFGPLVEVTREQMAAFLARLWRSLGGTCDQPSLPFTDVAGSFAAADIACLYGLEVTQGITDTTFGPLVEVTREQMAAFLARLWRSLGGTCGSPSLPFTDLAGSFAAADIACLYGLGVTQGITDTTFGPFVEVTREQMAAFLARLWRAAVDDTLYR